MRKCTDAGDESIRFNFIFPPAFIDAVKNCIKEYKGKRFQYFSQGGVKKSTYTALGIDKGAEITRTTRASIDDIMEFTTFRECLIWAFEEFEINGTKHSMKWSLDGIPAPFPLPPTTHRVYTNVFLLAIDVFASICEHKSNDPGRIVNLDRIALHMPHISPLLTWDVDHRHAEKVVGDMERRRESALDDIRVRISDKSRELLLEPDKVGSDANQFHNMELFSVIKCGGSGCFGFVKIVDNEPKCNLCSVEHCKSCWTPIASTHAHVCDPESLKTATEIRSGTNSGYTQCKRCRSIHYRLEGCDEMFCSRGCFSGFDFRTGNRIDNSDNPHFIEYENNKGQISAPELFGFVDWQNVIETFDIVRDSFSGPVSSQNATYDEILLNMFTRRLMACVRHATNCDHIDEELQDELQNDFLRLYKRSNVYIVTNWDDPRGCRFYGDKEHLLKEISTDIDKIQVATRFFNSVFDAGKLIKTAAFDRNELDSFGDRMWSEINLKINHAAGLGKLYAKFTN
jgi:hypothetical protein